MESKSKTLSQLGSKLDNIDNDIKKIKDCEHLMKKVVFYNGSGTMEEIILWKDTDSILVDFLLNHYEVLKEEIHKQIKDVVNS